MTEERKQEGNCRVCGEEYNRETVNCIDCETSYHKECWDFVGKCSVYACDSKEYTGSKNEIKCDIEILEDEDFHYKKFNDSKTYPNHGRIFGALAVGLFVAASYLTLKPEPKPEIAKKYIPREETVGPVMIVPSALEELMIRDFNNKNKRVENNKRKITIKRLEW